MKSHIGEHSGEHTYEPARRSRYAEGQVTRALFYAEIYRKDAGPQAQKSHFVRYSLEQKCRTRILRPAFCARLRRRNAHGRFTRANVCSNLQEKCRTPR